MPDRSSGTIGNSLSQLPAFTSAISSGKIGVGVVVAYHTERAGDFHESNLERGEVHEISAWTAGARGCPSNRRATIDRVARLAELEARLRPRSLGSPEPGRNAVLRNGPAGEWVPRV